MKRPVFIIIGTLLVFVLLGIWVYMLFFSSPKSDSDTFANLDFGDTTDTSIEVAPEEEKPAIDVGPEKLKQLTTKPIAGYQEVLQNASSTPEIYYIELGTGHIYSIDSMSGEERHLSGTTIKDSVAGAVTPNGMFALIQSGNGARNELFVGEINPAEKAITQLSLEEGVVSFKSTPENTFLYAVQTNSSVVGKEYFPISGTVVTLFTVPFREAAIVLGNTAEDTHHAYPKASTRLEGYLYKITDGTITRLPAVGYGLSASGNNVSAIYSEQISGTYQSFGYHLATDSTSPLPITTIPEKCTSLHMSTSSFLCAVELTNFGVETPDSWYQGRVSYADNIWEFEVTSENLWGATAVVDIEAESGRQLDIVNMSINQNDSNVYFLNKNDSTLWLYRRIIPTNVPSNEIDA